MSAHPSQRQLDKLTQSLQGTSLDQQQPAKTMTEEIKAVQPGVGAEYSDNMAVAAVLSPTDDHDHEQVENRS